MPFDPEKPQVTSGIRVGSPAGTTRGFGVAEFRTIGRLMAKVLDGLAANGDEANAQDRGRSEGRGDRTLPAVSDLRIAFPLP